MSGPLAFVAERLYGAALRLHPRRFRERFGDQMRQLFRDRCREAWRRAGAAGVVLLALRSAAAEARVGTLQRLEALVAAPRTSGLLSGGVATDLRHAARGLVREPGFSAVAVLTLALGIGASTAVFTAVDAVLLRPIPYGDPDRLVMIWNDMGHGAQSLPAVSARDYQDYRHETRLFEDFTAGTGGSVVGIFGILGGEAGSELVRTAAVDANFFSLLGVEPLIGRAFTAEEMHPGGPKLVLLSHRLWQRRYGGAADLVGRTVRLDGRESRVVGVLPPGFELLLPSEAFLLEDADVFVPLQFDYERAPPRNYTSFTVIGRLREGVTPEQAQEEMSAVAVRLRERHPVHAASELRIRSVPLQHDVVKDASPALLTLLGAVALVLAVACANAAHLLLARAASRRREVALRAALGAGRGRIARRLLAESAVLAGAAAALGLGLAWAALRAVVALRPAGLPRLQEIALDPTAVLFAVAAAGTAVVLAGLAPALDASRADLALLLRRGAHATADRESRRLRGGLVVAELAVTLVLLIGAGLLLRSFGALQQVRPGYDPESVLTFRLALPMAEYDDERVTPLRRRLQEELRALPGVLEVGTSTQLPLTGSGSLQPYAWDEETARNWEGVTADGRWITPGYLRAMGTRLLSGREFDESDIGAVPPRIVIDEVVAGRAFPGVDPVGRQLQIEPDGEQDRFATVIGVAEHQRLHDLSRPGLGQIYQPGGWRRLSFAIRTQGDPAALAEEVRRAAARVDPELAVSALQPMSALVETELARSRFTLLLMGVFGAVAVLLAAVGAAGVMAQQVALRRREIGVRLALGASPSRVRRELVAGGAAAVAIAVALGLATAALLAPKLGALLYGVSPRDAATYLSLAAVLAVVGVASCWVPARRASGVDPAVVLREP